MIISGCGFLGEAAADLFFGAGWEVLGLCAREESAARLRGKPYPIRVADISDRATLSRNIAGWEKADAVLHTASSRGGDAEAYRRVYLAGVRHLLAVVRPQALLFTGSTSVYAQTDGSVVTEASKTLPARETGKILLQAEHTALASGGWAVRLGGLYGPGRSALLRKFLSGEAVRENGGGRWLNQVHRDDAAQAVFHLVTSGAPFGIYNVVDNTPALQREVYGWLAETLQKSLPPEGAANPNRRRGSTSKRVSNAKLRSTGWAPAYPAYRDAILELLASFREAPVNPEKESPC